MRCEELALSLRFFGILEVELFIYTALAFRKKMTVKSVLVNAEGLSSLLLDFSPLRFVL